MKTKEKNKTHILSRLFSQILLIFLVATMTIVLYDMYINIEVEENDIYVAEKLSKEITTVNTEDISQMLEKVSKSVVRNIKNRKYRYINI